MTHDELLAKINDTVVRTPGQTPKDKLGQLMQNTTALRIVVELHKPLLAPWDSNNTFYCEDCNEVYPCPTIQTIEKALK